MQYGIDVSHWQSPQSPGGSSWTKLASEGCSFAMVRATYGVSVDDRAMLHVNGARSAGMRVGLYHFFRVGQSVEQQAGAFLAQARLCEVGSGDIAPAIDVEEDGPKGSPVNPAWSPLAQQLTEWMVEQFGEAMVYVTQRIYGNMGEPEWVRRRPLWVAHYTSAPSPATPDNLPWAIWQHRVGPFVNNGPGGAFSADGNRATPKTPPGPLDQDRANGLPPATRTPWADVVPDFRHADLVQARLDVDTAAALQEADLDHSAETMDAYREGSDGR